jgi:flagellar motor switch protein FliN
MATAICPRTLKILVVDDEAPMREVLKLSLESSGHRVLTAADGQAALEILKSSPVELVLTDLRMPGLSGTELIRAIKQRFPEMGVLMITGYATLDSALEAMRMGALDVLQKPVDLNELAEKIAKYAANLPQHAPGPPVENLRRQPDRPVEFHPMGSTGLPPAQRPDGPPRSRLRDARVTASVELGRASLQVSELLKLAAGSVVGLDKHPGEPAELMINDRRVALGEVVVTDGALALRVTDVVEAGERIQAVAQ